MSINIKMEPIDFTEKFDVWINGTLGEMIFFNIHDKNGKVNYHGEIEKTYEECLNILYLWKLNKNDVKQLILPDEPSKKLDELKELRDLIVKAHESEEKRQTMLKRYPNVVDFESFKKLNPKKKKR